MKSAQLAATVSLVVALATLSGIAFVLVSKPPGPTQPQVQVRIVQGSFLSAQAQNYVPRDIVVIIGVNNTIGWKNDDTSAHTVTSLGNFDSGNLNPNQVFVHTFTQVGTFNYVCGYHPWMKGSVIVRSGSQ